MPIIGLASDHAGYELKEFIQILLNDRDMSYINYGTYTTDSVDYPIYGHKLAKAFEKGEVSVGIGICGSGNGINMTLNKHQKVRSALCWNEEIARLAREHNNANVLVLPARFLSQEEAKKIIDIFLNTPFKRGNKRHQQRIEAIPLK
ncbi:ribose 5-phosphate isomerase B [Candidatus Azobacteroides pseudotrichonymphae]|uniref:ribose 5-phosphate isomerase B n=1 Tax=Candidatus Azobacteroides pseudotrichonymphae TaxID=511435 RepID=UPI00223C5ABF|nr:ribose 5-phosphate isomerase B [Candidatus Azobacteroides pseudotrichonymphae]MDR0529929.1 ribose 5-phosphate isomerase B [Bacteroidales bacterium OttesenSCG-928-I14]